MSSAGKTIEMPSRRFGKYAIRSRLGIGGMAEVFLAEAIDETGAHLNVALKLMRKEVSEEAFANEADLMGLLSHPNLVQRLEVGRAFDRRFIAMEFLGGGDLRDMMDAHQRQAGGFPPAMAAKVTLEVLKALAYFHQVKTRSGVPLGLVHGDVNPANVFFTAVGDVKLGDFGVANSQSINIGPRDGLVGGKLHYLSPEQTRGERLGPGSDLFAVGVMLFELLVGHHPFTVNGSDQANVVSAIRAGKPSVPENLDRRLARVLARALHADVKERYQTAGEFAGELYGFMLDYDLHPSPADVRAWLEEMLGVLV